MSQPQTKISHELSEAELIVRAAKGDAVAIRAIIQRHNRRLYRIARSVLRDDSEAEDAVQDCYMRAFSALPEFRGQSSLATWLSRIVLNEALQRARRRRDVTVGAPALAQVLQAQVIAFPTSSSIDPERAAAQRQLRQLLEKEIDRRPEEFRIVLVARVIEDMSVQDTAAMLGLQPATVKTRLHRARRLLKVALAEHVGPLLSDVFPFEGARCERMVASVLGRLGLAR